MEESRSLGERPREVNKQNKQAISNYILLKNIKRHMRLKYTNLRVQSELSYAILTLLTVTSSVGGGRLHGCDLLFPNVASAA